MSIQSRPVPGTPPASKSTTLEPQARPTTSAARVKRAPAPTVIDPDEVTPAVEKWLWFIIASSVVMVIGFFVPRDVLRPTVAFAVALMTIGLLMLAVQSWRSRSGTDVADG